MLGYDSYEKQHKVGIKLVCPIVEKLLKFKKVCGSRLKSAQKICPVMPNAPYIHPSHYLILESWQTFPNVPG